MDYLYSLSSSTKLERQWVSYKDKEQCVLSTITVRFAMQGFKQWLSNLLLQTSVLLDATISHYTHILLWSQNLILEPIVFTALFFRFISVINLRGGVNVIWLSSHVCLYARVNSKLPSYCAFQCTVLVIFYMKECCKPRYNCCYGQVCRALPSVECSTKSIVSHRFNVNFLEHDSHFMIRNSSVFLSTYLTLGHLPTEVQDNPESGRRNHRRLFHPDEIGQMMACTSHAAPCLITPFISSFPYRTKRMWLTSRASHTTIVLRLYVVEWYPKGYSYCQGDKQVMSGSTLTLIYHQ